jgi:hypothetical protein
MERHASWGNRLKEVANIAGVIMAKQRMGPLALKNCLSIWS